MESMTLYLKRWHDYKDNNNLNYYNLNYKNNNFDVIKWII